MLGASEVTDLEGEPTTMILLKQRKPYNNPNNLSVCPQVPFKHIFCFYYHS